MNNLKSSIPMVDLFTRDDTDIESGSIDMPWETIVETFSTHDIRKEKNGPCFIPCQLKERSKWILKTNEFGHSSFRNDLNVEAITMAVLDLDEKGALEKAQATLEGFEYFIYSTHSFSAINDHKFRLVLRLDDPIPSQEWPNFFNKVSAIVGADRQCGNNSRIYYYPAHNPDAGIQPVFKHMKGRKFGKGDLVELSDLHKGISYKAPVYNKDSPGHEKIVRQHFSGGAINESLDYSYESLLKRHKKSVERLCIEDSRHAFAMSVIAREVTFAGKEVDFFPLYQFLYKATEENGTKPLAMGDTPREIPELTTSALTKYGIGNAKSARHIPEALKKAAASARSGNWIFPRRKNAALGSENKSGKSLEALRTRHRDSMRMLMKAGDIVEFTKSILKNEGMDNGNKTDLRQISQFVYYCYFNHSVHTGNGEPTSKDLSNLTKVLSKAPGEILPETLSDSVSKGLWPVMCKASERATKGQRWNFESRSEAPKKELSSTLEM
jgi:hypothetical protein